MTDIHDIAAQGYAAADEDYERARPSYPTRAVELLLAELGIAPESTVLDLGAGTGKFTRLLRPTGATLLALEPVSAMRRHLADAVPEARVLDGTAESIPLPDGSVDAIVAATAFHWFKGDDALEEIARVLRPGGGLGLVWNNPDEDADWVAAGLDRRRRKAGPCAAKSRPSLAARLRAQRVALHPPGPRALLPRPGDRDRRSARPSWLCRLRRVAAGRRAR